MSLVIAYYCSFIFQFEKLNSEFVFQLFIISKIFIYYYAHVVWALNTYGSNEEKLKLGLGLQKFSELNHLVKGNSSIYSFARGFSVVGLMSPKTEI